MKSDVIIDGISLSQLESTGIAAAMVAGDILTDGFYSEPEIKFKTGKYDIVTAFDLKWRCVEELQPNTHPSTNVVL